MITPWIIRFRSKNPVGMFYGEDILSLLNSSKDLSFPDKVFLPEDYFFSCSLRFRNKKYHLTVGTEVIEEGELDELRQFDLSVEQVGRWFQRIFWKTAPGGAGECFLFLKSLLESDSRFEITFVGEMPKSEAFRTEE